MKALFITSLICALISLLAIGCRQEQRAQDSVEPGRALAGVRLGTTRDELSTQLGTPKQTIGPDRNGRTALSFPGGFSVVCDSNAVVVSVQAGKLFQGRTKEGIGIGSTKEDVVRVFGQPERTAPNTDTSADIYYLKRGLRLKIDTNGNVEHITIRPKEGA
jgi:hypothetical protein